MNRKVVPSGPDGPEYRVVSGHANAIVRNGISKETGLIQDALYQECKNSTNDKREKTAFLLGTVGCFPACDSFFVRGFRA